jgi:dipeptide/tripeptide permease
VQHGAAATAIFAVSSCSGLPAGWLYGLRRWRTEPRARLAVATAWSALGSLPLLAVGSPLGLGVVVALTGGAVPPVLALFSVLTASTVHRTVLTQAFSWLGSGGAAGSAGSVALCGRVVETAGVRGGFAVAAAATTMALLAAAGLRGTLRARRRRPPPTPVP